MSLPEPPNGESCPPGLVYVSDRMPGITRRRNGRGFSYRGPDGRPLGTEERARCVALAIPPAYREVWICPDPAGHLQFTGIDEAGRKQYRYHPDWSAWRARDKFGQLPAFGASLARFRARVRRDLEAEAGELEFSLAAIAVLLDRLHLRVGSAARTATSGTYGATTLLRGHLRLDGDAVRLRYRAKGGRKVEQTLRDRRLHRIFEAVHELPGRNLFTYVGADGEAHPVGSEQVNAYIAERTGVPGATAKTFRTWAGTVTAFRAARAERGKLTVRAMAEAAAERLHNTPAISRSAYIHPAVLELAGLAAEERLALVRGLRPAGPRGLQADERRVLALLGQR